jgi:hypothetical protein
MLSQVVPASAVMQCENMLDGHEQTQCVQFMLILRRKGLSFAVPILLHSVLFSPCPSIFIRLDLKHLAPIPSKKGVEIERRAPSARQDKTNPHDGDPENLAKSGAKVVRWSAGALSMVWRTVEAMRTFRFRPPRQRPCKIHSPVPY